MIIENSSTAIYRQIIDYFEAEVASGRIEPGEKIESIRGLALRFKVNPNTVQKALRELEWNGMITTDRTNGKFITEDTDRIELLRKDLAKTTIEDFIETVKKLGFSIEDIISILRKEWE